MFNFLQYTYFLPLFIFFFSVSTRSLREQGDTQAGQTGLCWALFLSLYHIFSRSPAVPLRLTITIILKPGLRTWTVPFSIHHNFIYPRLLFPQHIHPYLTNFPRALKMPFFRKSRFLDFFLKRTFFLNIEKCKFSCFSNKKFCYLKNNSWFSSKTHSTDALGTKFNHDSFNLPLFNLFFFQAARGLQYR